MISTPGGKVFTKQVVVNPSPNLHGRVYKTCLIVLDGQGIDVILGMKWMKKHKALLDNAARIVHLDSTKHDSVALELALPPFDQCIHTPYYHLKHRRLARHASKLGCGVQH
jgi:hypothetical protein